LIVSINTPLGNAGEYGDTLVVSGGHGAGGLGGFGRPFFSAAGAGVGVGREAGLDLAVALPFAEGVAFCADVLGRESSGVGEVARAVVVV